MSVIKFIEDPKENYSLALKKMEEQDFLFALRLLKGAIRKEKNSDYFVELAELYYKLKQYDESTATYIEMAKYIPSIEVALGALHSHQESLGMEMDPDSLSISSRCFFNLSRKSVQNKKLNVILKEYQKVVAKFDEPKLIDLKRNKILRKLQDAKKLALKGDYSKSMILLDSIEESEYASKVLELKIIVYFGAEDYDMVVKTARKYNATIKGNPVVARSFLYSLYFLNGKRINDEFEKEFAICKNEIMEKGEPDSIIALYELAQMIGYGRGSEDLVCIMEKLYPCDLTVLLTIIAHYGALEMLDEVDRVLKRTNEIFPNCPSVSYYNCLRKQSKIGQILPNSWYSLSEETIAFEYTRYFVLEYLKSLSKGDSRFDFDIFKSAITFLDVKSLRKLLTVKEVMALEEYKEVLVWGIENPYLGISNKILLIYLYLSTTHKSEKIFFIPMETGIVCTKLKGYKVNVDEPSEANVFNLVYANALFTEHDVDAGTILVAVKKIFSLQNGEDKELLAAASLYYYLRLKKYEPQLRLVADTFNVSLDQLKEFIEIHNI